MNAEANPEKIQDSSSWSILDGEFNHELLADYQARLEAIVRKVYEQWNQGDIANRIIVADVVQLAATICQPELFDGQNPDREKEIAKDIGTSTFASYNYSSEQRDELANLVSDIPTSSIPALKALETILLHSPIFLGEGRSLTDISRATVLHILTKQIGRSAKAPKAVYNWD